MAKHKRFVYLFPQCQRIVYTSSKPTLEYLNLLLEYSKSKLEGERK